MSSEDDEPIDICPCCDHEVSYIIEEGACHKCMYKADMLYEQWKEGE